MGDHETKASSDENESPFPLTDEDKWVLSQTDEEFHLHDWEELKEIINHNKLETLKRKPSDLRRYMAWTQQTKAQYGSITNYILQNRLSWGPPPFTYTSPIPFASPSDFKILTNDWPYGLKDDITHIVVWSKTPIPIDEATGDVTEDSRMIIGEFVRRTFGHGDRVVWFKNWVALQSIRALEHVHVMIKDARKSDIQAWTGESSGQDEPTLLQAEHEATCNLDN